MPLSMELLVTGLGCSSFMFVILLFKLRLNRLWGLKFIGSNSGFGYRYQER